MAHRYALAAVLLAALSVPAAAQQTTPSDTSKKSSGTTVTESAGAIADTAAKANANPNAAAPSTVAPSTVAPSPGATVTTPSTTAPSAPSAAPSAAPSTDATVTAPAPTSGAAVSAPSAEPSTMNAAAAGGATGQVQPTSGAIKVDVKVESSLANTVKISADSAFALARASNTAGEISSAELEMTDKRLVYQVKMVKGAGASTVYVDAMTGEVVKDKKFGGLKAAAENQEESQKLLEAKKDEQKEIKEEKKAP